MNILLYIFIVLLVGQVILFTLMMYTTYKMLNEYKYSASKLIMDFKTVYKNFEILWQKKQRKNQE